jgi:deoxyribodipyrimidine photolyase-like uncharacterized protein
MKMIILTDTFNGRQISKHRTVLAAVRAEMKHSRDVERRNGKGHYVWYNITSSDGSDIAEEIMDAKMSLDFC